MSEVITTQTIQGSTSGSGSECQFPIPLPPNSSDRGSSNSSSSGSSNAGGSSHGIRADPNLMPPSSTRSSVSGLFSDANSESNSYVSVDSGSTAAPVDVIVEVVRLRSPSHSFQRPFKIFISLILLNFSRLK